MAYFLRLFSTKFFWEITLSHGQTKQGKLEDYFLNSFKVPTKHKKKMR